MPDTLEFLLRLALAAVCGGAVGLEREIRLKEAGVRTHLIVCFASCMMMIVSKYGFADVMGSPAVSIDPGRIAAGLVTAIGFLGAGTIFARSRGITGLTTAAGLWATVGIGMTTGAGMYVLSIFSTGFIVVVQAILHRDHVMIGHVAAAIIVQLSDDPDAPERLRQALEEQGLSPSGFRYDRWEGVLSVELRFERLPCPAGDLGRLLTPLMAQPYIKSLRWQT